MTKRYVYFRRLAIGMACLLVAASALARLPRGGGALPFPLSYYASFANGPPSDGSYFPILIWVVDPLQTTGIPVGQPNAGAAAKAVGINTFLGLENWPTGFGTDGGQMAAIKALGMYYIGGKQVDYASGVTATSVPSILATVAAAGAQRNFIGYNLVDEPFCGNGPYNMGDIPNEVSAIQAYDATRPVAANMASWPPWIGLIGPACGADGPAALAALSINSFDMYPMTDPLVQRHFCIGGVNTTPSDSLSTPNDCIWTNGLGVQQLRAMNPSRPAWVFVEAGADEFGMSSWGNTFKADVANGSNIIVNESLAYQICCDSSTIANQFTATWLNLTVSGTCIPGGTTITGIVDGTHATMSHNATCNGPLEDVSVTGSGVGGNTDCVASANLCVVPGNRYRAKPVEVNGEVWNTIISGAYGIEWFCYDTVSTLGTFCLGDPVGGADATAAAANVTYINGIITTYARQLNSPLTGLCSMQNLDGPRSTATSCSDGILTMTTGTAAVPGLARAHFYGGATYLFAQSGRNGSAAMTFTLAGLAGKVATVVYDSNSQYDNAHNNVGATFTLNGSAQFSDTFGANGDNYQVRIYKVQ